MAVASIIVIASSTAANDSPFTTKHQPVPTAVITWRARGPSRIGYVLHPLPAAGATPVAALEPLPAEGALALAIRFADGRRGLFLDRTAPSLPPGVGRGEGSAPVQFGPAETDGQVAYVELSPGGDVLRSFVTGGSSLRVEGRSALD